MLLWLHFLFKFEFSICPYLRWTTHDIFIHISSHSCKIWWKTGANSFMNEFICKKLSHMVHHTHFIVVELNMRVLFANWQKEFLKAPTNLALDNHFVTLMCDIIIVRCDVTRQEIIGSHSMLLLYYYYSIHTRISCRLLY